MLWSSVLTDTGATEQSCSQDMSESTQHVQNYSTSLSLSPPVCCIFYHKTLRSKSLVDDILVDHLSTNGPVECMSLAWSADGQTLFAGYTDNLIR